jgi:hypothetical protein
MEVDALYFNNGCVLKIPDNCTCKIHCEDESVSCFCFGGLLTLRQGFRPHLFCGNDPLPKDWPSNPGRP